MLCERCKAKSKVRSEIKIVCRTCGKEAIVGYFNNNRCKECNEQDGTCEECGRKIK